MANTEFVINRRSEYDLSITNMKREDVVELRRSLELLEQQLPPKALPKITNYLIDLLSDLETGRTHFPCTVEMEMEDDT